MKIGPKKGKEKHISDTINKMKPNVIQLELLLYDFLNKFLP